MNKLIDVLPKFPQYNDFPYAADLECPECGKSGFFDFNYGAKHEKPNLIGWCETNIGYMGVFECPLCGQKFRFHCTIGTWTANIDEFEYYLYTYIDKCANSEEIKNKIGE